MAPPAPVGVTDTAEFFLERLHYGKRVSGASSCARACEGYAVTCRSRGLSPADDRALSAAQLLGLRRFEPDLIDAPAQRVGALLARIAQTSAGPRAVFLRARFRPEDGEEGAGRLYHQSALWAASLDVWRAHPAACLAMAASDLRATPDRIETDAPTRLADAPQRWRVRRVTAEETRRALAVAPWAQMLLEFFARAAQTRADATLTLGADDFAHERAFLFAAGLTLQFLPESYPRWREISIVSSLHHAPAGVCLRYLPSSQGAQRVAA